MHVEVFKTHVCAMFLKKEVKIQCKQECAKPCPDNIHFLISENYMFIEIINFNSKMKYK